jgi:hypothetical protein
MKAKRKEEKKNIKVSKIDDKRKSTLNQRSKSIVV